MIDTAIKFTGHTLLRFVGSPIVAVVLISWVGVPCQAREPIEKAIEEFTIENRDIGESSGLAASWRHEGILWTHNDSGDSPRLFALDEKGQHVAEIEISGAIHDDWEDIASYQIDGKPQLIIGDVGNNGRRRKEVVCYRLNEPKLGNKRVKVDQIWRIRFPDGPQDCEAIAVDVQERMILLVCKSETLAADVFSVPLETGKKEAKVTAVRLGSIALPMITAMDLEARDGRIVITSYVDTKIFPRKRIAGSQQTDWEATFAQRPASIRTPWFRQREAVCFDRSGDAIWLSSEKKPTPLVRVAVPR